MDSVTTRSRQKGFIDDDSHNNRNDDDLLYLNHNNNKNNNSNDDGIEVDLHGISISEESRLQQQSHSHSVTKQRKSAKKLDEYGFIVNIDEKGTIRSEDSFYLSGGATTPSLLTNSITSIHKSKNNHNDNTNNNHMIKQRRSGSRKRNNANSLTSYLPILRSSLDPNHLKSSSPKHRGSRNKNNHNNNDDDKGDNDDNDDKKHNNNHHHQYQRQRHTKQPATSTIKVSPSRNNKNRERKIKERLTLRREQKWNQMIHDYNNIVSSKPKRKKLYSRIRKGIPNSIRGQAWVTMAKVNIQVENNKGVYADLVEQSCNDKLEGIQQALLPLIAREEHENQYEREHDHQHDFHCSNGSHTSQNYHQDYDSDENREYHHANAVAAAADPTADIMKETIERDINRTFPRHSMFYDSYSDSDDDDDDDHAEKYEKSKEKSFHDNINRSNSDELSDESYDKISLSESLGSTGHGERIESIGVNMPENLLEGDLCEDEDGNEVQHEYSDSSHGEKNHDICCTEPVRAFTDADLCGDGKKEYELVLPSPPTTTTTTTLLSTVNTPLRKEKKKVDFATEEGGQASLRRVLRAYSLYDPEVGYCQVSSNWFKCNLINLLEISLLTISFSKLLSGDEFHRWNVHYFCLRGRSLLALGVCYECDAMSHERTFWCWNVRGASSFIRC